MSDSDLFEQLLEEQDVDSPSGSTPIESSGVSAASVTTRQCSRTSVASKASKAVDEPRRLICSICAKEYRSKSGLTHHLFLHTINDYNSRKPLENEIKSQINNIFLSILTEISEEPAVGVMGKEKRFFMEALISVARTSKCEEVLTDMCKPILDAVLTRTKVMPSAQFEESLKKLNCVVAQPSFLQQFWEKLLLCVPDEKRSISAQVGHRLVWRMSTLMLFKVQESVFNQMMKHQQRAVSSFSMSEENLLGLKRHVSFLLRAIYRVGAKSSSSMWQVRCQILRLRFVCGDVNHENFLDRNLWESGDVVLSDVCLRLFLGLERLIQSNQGKTCSAEIIFNSLTNVENHVILNDMRELSRGFLPEDAALNFLQHIIKSYCATSCKLGAQTIVAKKKADIVSLRTNLKRNAPKKSSKVAVVVAAQAGIPPKPPAPSSSQVIPSTSRRKEGQSARAIAASHKKTPSGSGKKTSQSASTTEVPQGKSPSGSRKESSQGAPATAALEEKGPTLRARKRTPEMEVTRSQVRKAQEEQPGPSRPRRSTSKK